VLECIDLNKPLSQVKLKDAIHVLFPADYGHIAEAGERSAACCSNKMKI